MEKKLLNITNINAFYGQAQVLFDVSFSVEPGAIVALIGANGAGKSTALNLISGFLRSTSGQVLFKDASLDKLAPEKIVNLGIAHVPEGRRLFGELTVKENLELGAFSSRARKDLAANMEYALELFPRLRERLNQASGSLSGGEQQMLAIARALMSRPELLMLDEPSLGLAPIIVENMFEIIKELNRKGVTILLVEQNVVQTLEIADYAYVLQTGHITNYGEPKTLLADDNFQKNYLGIDCEIRGAA